MLNISEILENILLEESNSYTIEEAENRNSYLSSFDGGIFASGSHNTLGTIVVRTSNELTASQQKELEAKLINSLIELK